MYIRIKYFLAVALLAGIIVAGGVFTVQADGGQPRVRMMHALTGISYVDVYLDGTKQISGLAYGAHTEFLIVTPGQHLIEFRKAGAAEVLQRHDSNDYRTGQDYTMFLYGREGEPDGRRIQRFDNRMNAPGGDNAAVRFVHLANNASGGTPRVRMCITQSSDNCPIGDTDYQTASAYAELTASIYDFQYRLDNNTTVIGQQHAVQLQRGELYSFISIGIYNSTPPLEIVTLVDNGSGSGSAPTYPPVMGTFLTPTMMFVLSGLSLLLVGIVWFSWRQAVRWSHR